MSPLWKRLDISQEDVRYISADDHIYYAREYIADRSYDASEANNLITNFKKPIDRKLLPEWRYKISAINTFATEISHLLKDDVIYVFAAMPTSKCKSDPEYDSRLEDTLRVLVQKKRKIIIQEPIATKQTILASHYGGTREPEFIYKNLLWSGFNVQTNHIILIDDVLTWGSHFKACQRMILEHHPDMDITGIFWAKTIWADDDVS
jgi:hypothetical protein